MRTRLAWLVGLSACMPAAEETLVQELRVLSVRATPPLLDLTRGTTIDATVYRPDDRPVDVLLWTCTPGPLGCFEAGVDGQRQPLSVWTTATSLDGEEARHTIAAAPATLASLEGVELPPAQVWALACVVGTCPIIDAVRAEPDPDSEAWSALVEQLANPFDLVSALPKVDTAASFRLLAVKALADDAPRPSNPVVTLADDVVLQVPSGQTLPLRFSVQSEAAVVTYPVATVGGFVESAYDVVDGLVAPELVAGGEDSEDQPPVPVGTQVEVYVSFEAEDGGSALWRGQVEVVE